MIKLINHTKNVKISKPEQVSEETIRFTQILAILQKTYADSKTQLLIEKAKAKKIGLNKNSTAFRILISTILSHRTRDEKTTLATNNLLEKYPSPFKLSSAPLSKIQTLIQQVGFYRSKSKYVKRCSQQLVQRFNGVVPFSRESLMELTGVGPKTSACVLNYAFSKPVVAVDTHVHRIANRLGLIKTKTPEESEIAITKITPIKLQNKVNEYLVLHGQNICRPIGPKCQICPINFLCNYKKKSISLNFNSKIHH